MNCPSCQSENLGDSLFCDQCGADLEVGCAACGAANRPSARFCRKCRAPLAAGEAEAPADARAEGSPAPVAPALPGTRLGARIRQSRVAVEGERKQVTVLFADVKGSMELAEQMDPEEWSGIMQGFFRILADGVERFEGFVDKFTGDGIMALFGAPISHEDHAQRACYAALHLRDQLARYATELKREHGVGFSTRIGLHSGEVVVGSIGDDLRMEYTAQGHTVGLAQRMESLASPDTCYLSAATAAIVAGYVDLEDLGEFRVKGLSEPVGVHRLVGIGSSRTRFDVSRSRGLSRFVGRDRDMQVLEEALAGARSGQGQVVGIVAEAGTGKSRLCHEFAERLRADGVTVNFGLALAHGKHLPYLPMLEVFRAYYGIREDDDDRTARERIAGRLLLLDEGLRDMLPVAFEFFGVPDPEQPVSRIDPDAKRRVIFSLLRRAIEDAESSAGRLVVVFEDLHWFDEASEDLLAAWVEAVEGTSNLLIVNFRPEYRAAWMERDWYRELTLAPLGAEATRELLGHLLGNDPSVRELAERIQERTSGNPFFTEEVVRSLVTSGDLVGSRGDYRLAVDAATIRVPPSVEGILSARIDRLGEQEKLVLQTAAVIGQTFSEDVLVRVAELPDDEVRRLVAALEAAEFVVEQAAFPVSEYAFQHPLTREVAVRTLLSERRRRLHAAAARAIEATQGDKLDARAGLLAHHFEEAGEGLVAAGWQMRAARFMRRRDFATAARHVGRALDLIRAEPESAEQARLGGEACREQLALAMRVGMSCEDAVRSFEEGLAWARRLDDDVLAARLHQGLSVVYGLAARPEPGLAHAEEWGRRILASPDPELRACARWPSIGPLVFQGDLARADAAVAWQLEATTGQPAWGMKDWGLSAQANALVEQGRLLWISGRPEESRAALERSIEVARPLGDIEDLCLAHVRLATVAWFVGDLAASRRAVQRMSDMTVLFGSRWLRAEYIARIAAHYLLEDNPEAAMDFLDGQDLDELGATGGWPPHLITPWRVRALHLTGQVDPALEVAEDGLDFLRQCNARLMEIDLATGLARIVLSMDVPGGSERAAALLDQADEVIAATGARVAAPFVLIERAQVAGKRGDEAGRVVCLQEAAGLFDAMGAPIRARGVREELAR
jgi:class 3 adenylate cyclase